MMINGRFSTVVDSRAFRAGDSFHLPLTPECGLELRDGTQHAEHELAAGSAGVDTSLVRTPELDAFSHQSRNNVVQVHRRSREPVEPRDHERVAFPAEVHGGRELRSVNGRARQLLCKYLFGSGGPQSTLLHIERLVRSTDPSIADDHNVSPLVLDLSTMLSCQRESDLKETCRASFVDALFGITRLRRANDRHAGAGANGTINSSEAAGLERLPLRQRTLRLSKGENRTRCAIRARAAGSKLWSKR